MSMQAANALSSNSRWSKLM